MSADNLYTVFDRMMSREEKETVLKQKSHVFWFYGLSGSGKSTLAIKLERFISSNEKHCVLLDGDNIRSGLNRNLGFSEEDRAENIRRISEVTKLFLNNGTIALASFITPFNHLRETAKKIVGDQDLSLIYVKASFEECAQRDVKGLYGKAKAGKVKNFTGQQSAFEEPSSSDLVLDTEKETEEESFNKLLQYMKAKIAF